jgi:cobalt-zinc-cadmium efflux system membrane fusion protein
MLFSVDRPDQFPLATAAERAAASELVVTGAVTPDVSRNIPVVSLASGRVMAIHVRLGDTVQKGQLLLTVRSDDVSGGYSNYRMAVADEVLARTQLERSKDLYSHGAIALNDLQVAQDT